MEKIKTEENHNNKLKVLFFHHGSFIGGGASISLINTIQGLKDSQKFDIKVLCRYDIVSTYLINKLNVDAEIIKDPCILLGKYMIGFINIFNIRMFILLILDMIRLPKSIIFQYKKINKERPDIIHLNSSVFFSTAIAARLSGVSFIWHIREIFSGMQYNPRRLLACWLIRHLPTKIIAISPYNAEKLGKDKKEKIEVIYNFVDTSVFNINNYDILSEKQKLGISEDDKIIISLGGAISFRKGVVQLIDAMKYLDSNIKLYIAGKPIEYLPPKKYFYRIRNILSEINLKIEDIIIKFGIKKIYSVDYGKRVFNLFNKLDKNIQSRIHFTGELENVAPLIACSDILFFGGTTPHFPRPIYEAWIMKKPIIAFNINGVIQNVDNYVDGILIDKMNGEEIANAIVGLLNAPVLIQKMCEAGYKKANEKFRFDSNVLKIIDIYSNINQNS